MELKDQVQGVVIGLFGAYAGGYFADLTSQAETGNPVALVEGLVNLQTPLLGVNLSDDAAWVDTILGHLGVSSTSAAYTAAAAWANGELDAGASRAEVVLAAVTYLLGDSVEAQYASVATAFKADVAAGVVYSEGEGAEVLAIGDLREAAGNPATGTSFTLTTGVDTFVGTAGNDTITGTSATLQAGDTIIDQSTTDNDVLNLTLTAVNATARISNIENVNVNWNAFGTANYDALNTTGATITGTSSKVGFLGSFTVDNTGANKVVAGAGMTGTLQVNDATNTTVTGTAAKVVNVDGSATREDNLAAVVVAGENTTTINVGATAGFDTVTVTGGAKTTSVTVNDSAAITVDAAAATTVTLNGTADDDTATVTLGVDADLIVGGTTLIEEVTVNAADGTTVDITGSNIEKLTVASAGAVTLVADSAVLNGNTVTDEAESLNIEVAHTGAADLSKVSADLITLTATHASALTFATGANVLVAEDVVLNAGASFVGKSATTGTLNLTVLADQTNDIEVTTLKTLNLTVELNADDADKVATLGGITSANDVTLKSANDVVVTALAVKNLDASASTGDLTVTQSFATRDLASLVGSQGNNDVTLDNVDADVSVVTSEGDDKVTLGTAAATGDVTLVLGNGDNEVDAGTNGIDGADLSIVTGTGDDVVSATLINAVNFVAELGAGNNEITLDSSDNGAAQNVTIVTGAGNDTLTFADDTDATDTISWTAGAGTNTIDLNGKDIKAGTFSLTGVTHILDSNGAGTVDGSLLTGKSYTIQGNGSATTLLDVVIGTAGSYNFSGLVLDNTLTKGIGGLNITGSVAGSDTIVATTGNDTIVASANGTNTITGGKGQDDLSSNGSATTFVFAAGDSGKTATTADIIQDFVTGTDKLKIGIAGSATTFAAIDVNTDASDQLASAADAVAAANTLFGAGQAGEDKSVLFLYDSVSGVDGWLAIDRNGDAVVDELIQLVGLTADTDVVAADIIA